MKATQLNNDVTCPVCTGNGAEPTQNQVWGQCPLCEGTGTVNRVTVGQDLEDDHGVHPQVLIHQEFEDYGTHAAVVRHELPVEHPVNPSFNGLFGDFVPPGLADVAPEEQLPQNVRDRLTDATDLAPTAARDWANNNGIPELGDTLQRLIDEQPTL